MKKFLVLEATALSTGPDGSQPPRQTPETKNARHPSSS